LAAAPSFAVSCGDIIMDAQTLTADLNCATEPALTIEEGGSLDMAGFKVTCMGTGSGIELNGEGAKLSNGVITGCSSAGVRAAAGKHKIHRVLVSSCGFGFMLVSTGNKISECAALNNSGEGFYAPAPDNSLSRLIAKGNGGTGVYIGNARNKVTDVSISADGATYGMYLAGQDIKVSKVRITGAGTGVFVTGQSIKISDVTSLKHTGTGFRISGSNIQLKKCVAETGTADAGFDIPGGSDNSISGCRSTGGTDGIRVVGGTNVVSKNKVFGAADNGIEVSGAGNIVKGNFAVGSGNFDLFEPVAGCANGDVWEKNTGSRNDVCIE
jgi:hypothetical protein